MKSYNRVRDWGTGSELKRVLEPLANYICATEQPKAALTSALAALVQEVEATNRAAIGHFRTFSEN